MHRAAKDGAPNGRCSFSLARRNINFLFSLLLCLPLAAQTLARPGWVGSGLAQVTWWQNAVFYCIQPKTFQDSDGDGIGDLRGIVQRLDYLQSLGVDAIVLEPPFDDAGFDDLLSEASRRHVRIIVELSPEDGFPAKTRAWLTRGAAGIYVKNSLPGSQPGTTAALMQALRSLAASYPGERIVLADDDVFPQRAYTNGAHELERFTLGKGASTLETYRSELDAAQTKGDAAPFLQLDDKAIPDATQTGMAKILASMLLASHGPVLWRYGQEIGLSAATLPTMQWTPANITLPKPAEPVAETPQPTPAPQGENVYGPFVPYVPPVKKTAAKHIDAITGKPFADPNSLMGFTSGKLPEDASTSSRASVNVAVEDGSPDSLLNFYRKLSQLRHGNIALQRGPLSVLYHNADNALVWVRRAPGAGTTGTVVVACNLSAKSTTLSLKNDMDQLHLRQGGFRVLLISDKSNLQFQTTEHLTLAPWSVFIGELHPY